VSGDFWMSKSLKSNVKCQETEWYDDEEI